MGWILLVLLTLHGSKNPEQLINPEIESYWKTPDLYIGGAEHAVLHLLYARFWHHVLYEIGVVSEPEPFKSSFTKELFSEKMVRRCPKAEEMW